jgi:hypothetical protein
LLVPRIIQTFLRACISPNIAGYAGSVQSMNLQLSGQTQPYAERIFEDISFSCLILQLLRQPHVTLVAMQKSTARLERMK